MGRGGPAARRAAACGKYGTEPELDSDAGKAVAEGLRSHDRSVRDPTRSGGKVEETQLSLTAPMPQRGERTRGARAESAALVPKLCEPPTVDVPPPIHFRGNEPWKWCSKISGLNMLSPGKPLGGNASSFKEMLQLSKLPESCASCIKLKQCHEACPN